MASLIDHLDLAGYLLNWGLFGALSVQVYNYHLGFPNDKRLTKVLVNGVYLLEILQTGFTIHAAFSTTETGLNPSEVVALNLRAVSGPIISAIVAFIGQIFYAYRIYVLSSSKFVCSVIAMVAFLQCGAGITYGVTFLTIPAICWSFFSAVCDLIIAGYMSYFLRRRNTIGHKSTQLLIKRIVRLTVETGILTATLQIGVTVGFLAYPFSKTLLKMISKVYANTILVMLNSRLRTAEDGDDSDGISGQGSIWFRRPETSIPNRQISQHGVSLVPIVDIRRAIPSGE